MQTPVLLLSTENAEKRARYSGVICLFALLRFHRIYARGQQHTHVNQPSMNERWLFTFVYDEKETFTTAQRTIYTRLLRSFVDCDVFSFTLSVETYS